MTNQRGLAHIFVIAIILVGLIAAVYLIANGQNFFPRAQQANTQTTFETSFGFRVSPPKSYLSTTTTVGKPMLQVSDSTDANVTTSSEAAEYGKIQYSGYEVGEEFSADVLVRSEISPTTIYTANITYPADLLEIVRIEPAIKDQTPASSCIAELSYVTKGRYSQNVIVVGFNPDVSYEQAQQLINGFGMTSSIFGDDFNTFKYLAVYVPENTVKESICKFREQNIVASAEPDSVGAITSGSSNGNDDEFVESSTSESASDVAPPQTKTPSAPTFITNWTSQIYDNAAGTLSLKGDVTGGLVTSPDQPPVKMASIIFKAKKEGNVIIKFEDSSVISNTLGTNILQAKNPAIFTIGHYAGSGPMCDKFSAPCAPNQKTVHDKDSSPYCPSFTCVDDPTFVMPTPPPPPPLCVESIDCTSDQIKINNGSDPNGCATFSCVYIGNVEASKCDPNTAKVFGSNDENGRIICESKDAEGNKQSISYSFADFNKDGEITISDVGYFFTTDYWQSN